MKITNKTTKIIGIAGVAILPNESAAIGAADAESSMVKHLVATGKISLSGDNTRVGGSNAEPPADGISAGSDGGNDESGKKKPLSRMSKDELVDECLKLGLDILEDDTKDTLVEKIRVSTAG